MLGNDFISDLPFCEPCVMAKQYRHSFLSGIHLYKEILDYPHADLWVPESHEFHGENKYFFSIFYDISRRVLTFFLLNFKIQKM